MPFVDNKVVPIKREELVLGMLGREMKIRGELNTMQQSMARVTVSTMNSERFRPEFPLEPRPVELPEQVQGALAEYSA